MKHLILILFITINAIVFSAIPLSTNAQKPSIGIKEGIAHTNIMGEYTFKIIDGTVVSGDLNHYYGICYSFQINDLLSINGDINYERKSFSFSSDVMINGIAFNGNYLQDYITTPLTIAFSKGESISWNIYTGAYLGFLVRTKNQTNFINSSSQNPVWDNISNDPSEISNKVIYGGIVGMGLKIPVCNTIKICFDLRYSQDISHAINNTNFEYEENYWDLDTPDNFQNVKYRSMSLSLGFMYEFEY